MQKTKIPTHGGVAYIDGVPIYYIDPSKVDFVKGLNPQKDIVFNCIHGDFGESGHVSAILDYYKVPYTFSNSYTSAISMDKLLFKAFAAQVGVPVMKDDFFGKAKDLENPVIIKSARGGGSIGMSLSTKDVRN